MRCGSGEGLGHGTGLLIGEYRIGRGAGPENLPGEQYVFPAGGFPGRGGQSVRGLLGRGAAPVRPEGSGFRLGEERGGRDRDWR